MKLAQDLMNKIQDKWTRYEMGNSTGLPRKSAQ